MDAVHRAFAPSPRRQRRVGAEVEMFVLGSHAPATVDSLKACLGAQLIRRAKPTFEPGGQLELSPAPQTSVAALVREIQWCTDRLIRSVPGDVGEVVLTGVNPRFGLKDVPLVRPTPRYLALQRLLDRTGIEGRQMMRLTASLQVCVDLAPGRDRFEQWLVANLAGPPLAAAFAHSPHAQGHPTTMVGNRTRIWQALPQDRAAYDGRHLDPEDPIGAYRAFAAAAPQLAMPEARRGGYHLTTLFPPVRPRGGYLEIRYLDAQPVSEIPRILGLIWDLMYDRTARRKALDLLLPTLPNLWECWTEASWGRSVEAPDLFNILGANLRMPA